MYYRTLMSVGLLTGAIILTTVPRQACADYVNPDTIIQGSTESQQTSPTHPCRQWSLKPTGFFWVKLPLGRPHFSLYDMALYYIV